MYIICADRSSFESNLYGITPLSVHHFSNYLFHSHLSWALFIHHRYLRYSRARSSIHLLSLARSKDNTQLPISSLIPQTTRTDKMPWCCCIPTKDELAKKAVNGAVNDAKDKVGGAVGGAANDVGGKVGGAVNGAGGAVGGAVGKIGGGIKL